MSDKFIFVKLYTPILERDVRPWVRDNNKFAMFNRPFQRGLLKLLGKAIGVKQSVKLREYDVMKLNMSSNFSTIEEARSVYDKTSVQEALEAFHDAENKRLRRTYGLGYGG